MDVFFVWLEVRTELSSRDFMNFMFENVKGDWEGLFDSWKWHYEFTNIDIKKILRMLRTGIIVSVGKMKPSKNNYVGRSKRKGSLVRPTFRQEKRLKSGFRERA